MLTGDTGEQGAAAGATTATAVSGQWSIHIGIHLAITKPTPEPYHIVYQMEHVQ